MAAAVRGPGRPKKLFDVYAPIWLPSLNFWSYCVSPDQKRFLFNVTPPEARKPVINVILNWQRLAEARAK
jgi:hypothetical protein